MRVVQLAALYVVTAEGVFGGAAEGIQGFQGNSIAFFYIFTFQSFFFLSGARFEVEEPTTHRINLFFLSRFFKQNY